MTRLGSRVVLAGALMALVVAAGAAELVSLFDGKTLEGWHVSAASPHSQASGNRSGGLWRVEAGAIAGSQDTPGNGGLLLTNQTWGDFELLIEILPEWGLDSGVFLRSTEDGRAYQVMIDYYPGGTIGGIWGERLAGKLDVRAFSFGESPADGPGALPFRPGEWNDLRIRITGQPPRIVTWLNGAPVVELTDTEPRHAPSGSIALQVHGGGDTTGSAVRFRNVRLVPLD
jgi:hypothetical protein